MRFLNRETAQIDALIAEQQRLIELLQEKRQAVISHAVTKGLNPDVPLKDSGVEWLGKVPEHWEVRPLKHLLHVQTGMAKGKDLEGIETVDIPYLRVANVQDGYLDLEEVRLLSVPVTSVDRYLLKEGDVLMNEGCVGPIPRRPGATGRSVRRRRRPGEPQPASDRRRCGRWPS